MNSEQKIGMFDATAGSNRVQKTLRRLHRLRCTFQILPAKRFLSDPLVSPGYFQLGCIVQHVSSRKSSISYQTPKLAAILHVPFGVIGTNGDPQL